jgi:DNA-binding response OmpR family regulator
MRALVVEVQAELRIAIRDALASRNYIVDVASEVEDGAWLAQHRRYDVVVLAIDLPGGPAMLEELRSRRSGVAVLALGPAGGQAELANVYLAKPVELDAVIEHVRTLVRFTYASKPASIRVEDLEIDTVTRTVKRDGTPIAFSPREYALLEYLALRAGEPVSRSDILEMLYELGPGRGSNLIDVYISYLRKKLGSPRLIATERGRGYVLGSPRASQIAS